MNEIEKTRVLIERLRSSGRYPDDKARAYKLQEKLYKLEPGKHLYIIQLGDTDIYKIGISKHPDKRLKQIQRKCPIPLTLIYTNFGHDDEFAERYLHVHFKRQRVKGEWFKLSTADIIHIVTRWCSQEYQYPDYSEN
jgi:hypothetical protein